MINSIEEPSNLEEAHVLLEKMLGKELETVKNIPSEDLVYMTHSHLGRILRNEWGLWTDGKIKNYFAKLGIWHADDMSSIIIESFHCKINNKHFDLNAKVIKYKNFWENINGK